MGNHGSPSTKKLRKKSTEGHLNVNLLYKTSATNEILSRALERYEREEETWCFNMYIPNISQLKRRMEHQALCHTVTRILLRVCI